MQVIYLPSVVIFVEPDQILFDSLLDRSINLRNKLSEEIVMSLFRYFVWLIRVEILYYVFVPANEVGITIEISAGHLIKGWSIALT